MLKIVKTYDGVFPSSIDSVGVAVRDVINALVNNFGPLLDCTLFELTVILNEIVINAVKHGNKGDLNKFVKLSSGITEDGFVCFIVEDEGCGYDYNVTCINNYENSQPEDICDIMESGRGMIIVKNLCDCVKVNSKGNKIVVLKKLR
jgi:Anti-sigma regulatory factor (Ser/Thr protein kinase)